MCDVAVPWMYSFLCSDGALRKVTCCPACNSGSGLARCFDHAFLFALLFCPIK